jgi:hypothetical protein
VIGDLYACDDAARPSGSATRLVIHTARSRTACMSTDALDYPAGDQHRQRGRERGHHGARGDGDQDEDPHAALPYE